MKASIDRIKWLEGEGNTRAYLDICFDGAVVCKGFKIMNSVKGPFLAPPSHKDKNSDKWFPDVTFKSRDIQDSFQEHILALANKMRGGADPAKNDWSEDEAQRGFQQEEHMKMTGEQEARKMLDDAKQPERAAEPQGSIPAPEHGKCSKCGAAVVNIIMKNGKWIMVDAGSVPVGALTYDRDIMIAHVESCTA